MSKRKKKKSQIKIDKNKHVLSNIFLIFIKYLIILTIIILTFWLCLFYYGEPDIWHYLKEGEIILKEKTVPHQDIFSWSKTTYWVNHQWLTSVIFYIIHRKFNFAGLIIFKALIGVLIILILFKLSYEYSKNLILSFFIIILSIFVLYLWIAPRPQIFTYLFLTILFYIIYQYQEKNNLFIIFLIIPVMYLWINLHGAFVIGYVFITLFIICELIKNFIKLPLQLNKNKMVLKKIYLLIGITFVSFLIGFINPNTYHAYTHPFSPFFNKDVYAHTIEWQKPNLLFHLIYPYDGMLLITSLIIILSIKRINLTHLVFVIIFIYFSLTGWRNIPLFGIIATPILVDRFNELLKKLKFGNPQITHPVFLFFIIVSCISIIIFSVSSTLAEMKYKKWRDKISERMPVKAVEFLKKYHLPGRMLSSTPYGSYFIWNLYPQYKVGIDGRWTNVYDVNYLKDYITIDGGGGKFDELIEKYGINFYILPANKSKLLINLINNRKFNKIYRDKNSIIFIKNTHSNIKIINKIENDLINNIRKAYKCYNERDIECAIKFLEKAREIKPDDGNIVGDLGAFYIKVGDVNKGIRILTEGVELDQDNVHLRFNLAVAYETKKMYNEAIKEYKKVLEMDPNNIESKKAIEELINTTIQ